MISRISPVYKADLRQQPKEKGYSQNRKPKENFADVLDKEMSMGLGVKISVKLKKMN